MSIAMFSKKKQQILSKNQDQIHSYFSEEFRKDFNNIKEIYKWFQLCEKIDSLTPKSYLEESKRLGFIDANKEIYFQQNYQLMLQKSNQKFNYLLNFNEIVKQNQYLIFLGDQNIKKIIKNYKNVSFINLSQNLMTQIVKEISKIYDQKDTNKVIIIIINEVQLRQNPDTFNTLSNIIQHIQTKLQIKVFKSNYYQINQNLNHLKEQKCQLI